jgi:3-oxoacyl-[acyl-carrier protein] reductase
MVRGILEDKVVVVTGGANGIGRATCAECARQGGTVVVADIAADRAEAVRDELEAAGARASAAYLDVTDRECVSEVFGNVVDRHGRIDGLVNCAAIYASVAVRRAPYDQITEAEWAAMMDVNLKGMWLCSTAAAAAMRPRGRGSIVNVGSGTAFKGTPDLIHYVTTKAGVLGFTRALARELGPSGVRVNCVAPGVTVTEPGIGHGDVPTDPTHYADRALARAAFPEDIAGSVLFFLSDASAFVTGQTLVVDGGSLMH